MLSDSFSNSHQQIKTEIVDVIDSKDRSNPKELEKQKLENFEKNLINIAKEEEEKFSLKKLKGLEKIEEEKEDEFSTENIEDMAKKESKKEVGNIEKNLINIIENEEEDEKEEEKLKGLERIEKEESGEELEIKDIIKFGAELEKGEEKTIEEHIKKLEKMKAYLESRVAKLRVIGSEDKDDGDEIKKKNKKTEKYVDVCDNYKKYCTKKKIYDPLRDFSNLSEDELKELGEVFWPAKKFYSKIAEKIKGIKKVQKLDSKFTEEFVKELDKKLDYVTIKMLDRGCSKLELEDFSSKKEDLIEELSFYVAFIYAVQKECSGLMREYIESLFKKRDANLKSLCFPILGTDKAAMVISKKGDEDNVNWGIHVGKNKEFDGVVEGIYRKGITDLDDNKELEVPWQEDLAYLFPTWDEKDNFKIGFLKTDDFLGFKKVLVQGEDEKRFEQKLIIKNLTPKCSYEDELVFEDMPDCFFEKKSHILWCKPSVFCKSKLKTMLNRLKADKFMAIDMKKVEDSKHDEEFDKDLLIKKQKKKKKKDKKLREIMDKNHYMFKLKVPMTGVLTGWNEDEVDFNKSAFLPYNDFYNEVCASSEDGERKEFIRCDDVVDNLAFYFVDENSSNFKNK